MKLLNESNARIWRIFMMLLTCQGLAVAKVFYIYPNTSANELASLFPCSRVHAIGAYNEYFQSCTFLFPTKEYRQLHFVDRVLNPRKDFPHIASGVFHIELEIDLPQEQNSTVIYLKASQIYASAISFRADRVLLDEKSAVNASNQGLKYGPGFNSFPQAGSIYGGMGGISLSEDRDSCPDSPPIEDYVREIGSISANRKQDFHDFRLYGSGGGDNEVRGGGRINITAHEHILVNGSLESNGGSNNVDTEAAGSGGTIFIRSKNILGKGNVKTIGGAAYPITKVLIGKAGGGGGGGGGRIVIRSTQNSMNPSNIQAFGGSLLQTKQEGKVQAQCQLGGPGTILELQDVGRDSFIGTLIVKAAKDSSFDRTKGVSYTPLLFHDSVGKAPAWLMNVIISGNAMVVTPSISLARNYKAVLSVIVIGAGAEVQKLPNGDNLKLSAAEIKIQGIVGTVPSSQLERRRRGPGIASLFLKSMRTEVSGGSIFADMVVASASQEFVLDKSSLIHFKTKVLLKAISSVSVLGFLVPSIQDSIKKSHSSVNNVTIVSLNRVFVRLQPSQKREIDLTILSGNSAVLGVPSPSPFKSIWISSLDIVLEGTNTGTGTICSPFDTSNNACINAGYSATELKPFRPEIRSSMVAQYTISLLSTNSVTVKNILSGSLLICSPSVIIQDKVSTFGQGCLPGSGPGNSTFVSAASGGAGHGGRGGDIVSPGGHILKTINAGGKTYDNISSPEWAGSGASHGDSSEKVEGGAGGGVIYIQALTLTLDSFSVLSVAGGNGFNGGGGGSGGTLVLLVRNLTGNGTIDVSGGCACSEGCGIRCCTSCPNQTIDYYSSSVYDYRLENSFLLSGDHTYGGGGGGGFIRLLFLSSAPYSSRTNGEHFLKAGGKILTDGGRSAGESGHPAIASPSLCDPGRGGVFCLTCGVGYYSPSDNSSCLPCPKGYFSVNNGSTSCSKCPVGSITLHVASSSCSKCSAGTYAPQMGSSGCLKCHPGSYAPIDGAKNCTSCPKGSFAKISGASNCTICPLGYTTRATGSVECRRCKGHPRHSSFNKPGSCSYMCDKGRVGIDCLTPFENLVRPIGGLLGFLIITFGLIISIFSVWGFSAYRHREFEKQLYSKIPAECFADAYKPEESKEFQISKTEEQRRLSVRREEYWRTQKFAPRLTRTDLQGHMERLYFIGNNTFESNWELLHAPSPVIRKHVYSGSFESFTRQCSALLEWPVDSATWCFSNWEFCVFRLLQLACPPLAYAFQDSRRFRRIKKLSAFVHRHRGGFFRDLNARSHSILLKLNYSPDLTMGYIDIIWIASILKAEELNISLGKIRMPCTIFLAGDGSFMYPYHIDTNDILVRSIPSLLQLIVGETWVDLIADLNEHLRVIPSNLTLRTENSFQAAEKLGQVIQNFNAKRKLAGYIVDIVRVTYSQEREHQFQYHGLQTLLDEYQAASPPSEILLSKLALRIDSELPNASEGELSPTIIGRKPSSTMSVDEANCSDAKSSECSSSAFQLARSSIRYEALFGEEDTALNCMESSPRSGNHPASEEFAPFLLAATRRRSSNTLNHLNDGICNKISRMWSHLTSVFAISNIRARHSRFNAIRPLGLMVSIMLEILIVVLLCTEFYCIQVDDPTKKSNGCTRVGFIVLNAIYPGALFVSPVYGIIFLLRRGVCGRIYAQWNLAAIMNLCSGFLCCLLYFHYLSPFAFLEISLGLLLKLFQQHQVRRLIAQFEHERPRRGWTGLSTTRDNFDAIDNRRIRHT